MENDPLLHKSQVLSLMLMEGQGLELVMRLTRPLLEQLSLQDVGFLVVPSLRLLYSLVLTS